ASMTLAKVDPRGATWLAAVRRAPREHESPEIARLFVSRDGDGERWEAVAPPAEIGALRVALTDGRNRVFVATDARLYETDDLGATWSAPRALPGSEAREVDACGALLVARARVDDDWFYHRSLDRGRTWRPFRLGAI